MKKIIKSKPAIIAICLLALILVVCNFPVYRIAMVDGSSYYDTEEISMLAYVGTPWDRSIAKDVLEKADTAFSDLSLSQEQNEVVYGLLSRYATSSERNAVDEKHSLKLWSAHFDSSSGYMWVYYSAEIHDASGKVISRSENIPSLWRVEKDADGAWAVVGIKEHP